jgi:16S rRNA (uracil1498-N3)-methyltransferase
MATPRFFVPGGLIPGQTVELPASVAHHARRVLRLRAGEALVLFDGLGNEFEALLGAEPLNETRSQASVLRGGPVDREAKLQITLVQALCAQEKIDWMVEKCVELGAARLILAPAARSVVRLDAARRQRRAERLRELVVAACCQCGRNRLPEVELAEDLGAALQRARPAERRWILDPNAAAGLQAGGAGSVACVIGPEGGFAEAEIDLARSMGYEGARLGPRVLRAETAGLAVLSALLALHGELA